MQRLFAGLDIDYAQWQALTRTALRIDLRASQFRASHGTTAKQSERLPVGQLIFYLALGLAMALAVAWVQDLFMAALIVLSYVLFMVGTAVLLDHGTAVTSPADYAVLGYQPISSRTWFAARLTNVLVYTLGMATVAGLLPSIAFFVKHGFAVGVAAIVALYTAAISITLAIILGYVHVLRIVGEQRLRRMLSYLQLFVGFVVYGGFFLIGDIVTDSAMSSLTLVKTPWLLLYPGSWYASYLEIAAGRTGIAEMIPALASIVVLVLVAIAARGRLSLEYAAQLGATAAASEQKRAPAQSARPPLWFRAGEARAMAIVVRAQFRNDMKFRMGVLGVIPITVLYLFLGLKDGRDEGIDSALRWVTLAVILFPIILKTHLARSDAFRASWIFFASPADRTRLIRAAQDVLAIYFLLPYLAFVGALLIWLTKDVSYVALYVTLAALVSHLVLLVVTLADPALPFSRPMEKGKTSGMFFLMMIVASIAGAMLPVLLRTLNGNTIAIATVFATLIVSSALIDRLTRLRVERQARELEFEG